MDSMKRTLIAAAAAVLLTVPVLGMGNDDKLGAGVTLTDATPIAAIHAKPADFVGKTVRIDGVVTAVCQEMGCWLAIASEQEKGLIVRLKVDHDAGIMFPVEAKGKKVSAEGVFEKIGADDKEGNEAAAEQKPTGGKADAFGKSYQLKGRGAFVY